MSVPLGRQSTGERKNINNITKKIKQKNNINKLQRFIKDCLIYNDLFVPNEIDIEAKDSGSYINLIYEDMTLTFVCHTTKTNRNQQYLDNRMHCKVIENNRLTGYRGVYLDDNLDFMFKERTTLWKKVNANRFYFFCIFNAINSLYPQYSEIYSHSLYDPQYPQYSEIYAHPLYDPQYPQNPQYSEYPEYLQNHPYSEYPQIIPPPIGGKKNNIQINLNNYNVSELKNICRNYKIKNYSKLNKVDLILLIKKNKKLFK